MADEQESASVERVEPEPCVASDEKAAAEAEIEPGKSSDEETEIEPDERATAEVDSGEAGCPIRMGHIDAPRCGRKLYGAPDGIDEKPVCLMHSKDPKKQSGPLFDEFLSEFEGILQGAGEKVAHFEHFVFPLLKLGGRKFSASCWFTDAIFTQEADFAIANFTKTAHFHGATFTKDANFTFATFMQDAGFFSNTFAQGASFLHATFTQKADFWNTTFAQDAIFCEATFTQNAEFSEATFAQGADFGEATFMQAARFVATEFGGAASWKGGRFLDQAEFRRTQFRPLVEGEPSAVFALANFSKPDEIVFDDVDLSRALFHNCDVSRLWFTSSARWAKREENRGLMVFDEAIPAECLERQFEDEPRSNWHRDYGAVAQIYQQLKKNYDARGDYWTANEFHFGEMEMKRLAGPTGGPLLRPRRWLHRNLSLVALYRYASDYGNSYGKPVLWLLGILVLFAALLPLPGVGLKRQGVSQPEGYASVWNVQKGYGENLWTEARLVGKGVIAAVDTATFQKSAEYSPAYPWGRVLAIFETLLTSTLFGLFLLAIRRQFRR
jgi:hypothetical protein